jgi:hypothetical protein
MLAASPALAARCRHGEMLRVRLGKCVSLSSPLARGFEARRLRTAVAQVATVRAKPGMVEAPPLGIPLPDLSWTVGAEGDEILRRLGLMRSVLGLPQ